MRYVERGVAALVVAAGGGVALAGPDWAERGDAGDSSGSAQVPDGPAGTSLSRITGGLGSSLLGEDFVDMYYIGVADPDEFSARVRVTPFDSTLWLFRLDSRGLLANDDAGDLSDDAARLTRFATDGSGASLNDPGDYLLAISGPEVDAASVGGAIFRFLSKTEISGPDGDGGGDPLLGWPVHGPGAGGSYRIDLTGVTFPQVPAPGSAGLLGLGVLGGGWLSGRRRVRRR